MQISDSQILFRMLDISSFRNREIEEQLKVGWEHLGIRYARILSTPPLTALLAYL
jgi:hypothetical protein